MDVRRNSWACRLVAVAVTLPALTEAAHGQQMTWIVDQRNGPGTNFTDIPPAVAAARAGDVILVRSGQYSHATISKGISLMGVSGAAVDLRQGLTVSGLPHDERCVIRRVSIVVSGAHLAVSDNRGVVSLERARLGAGTGAMFALDRNRLVTMTDCCGEWARIDQSTVVMSKCVFSQILTPPAPYAMSVARSTLVMSESNCLGSRGIVDPLNCIVTLRPGPGMIASQSHILLTGASGFIRGGVARNNLCGIHEVAPGIIATNVTVMHDPTVTATTLGPVQGSAVVVGRHVPSLVAQGTSNQVDVTLFGNAGASTVLFASPPIPRGPLWGSVRPIHGALAPPPWPGIWLDLTAFTLVGQGTIGPGRTWSTTIPKSALVPAGIAGVPMMFQAATVEQTGVLLSTPSVGVFE